MSRTTQLYIKVNDKYQEVELFDNLTIPITLKVTDIRNFGSKTSGYSLDFEIPHTPNNAKLFGLNSYIDVYESTFEVGKDYPAYLTTNSLQTFSGQFRLKKIIKQNRGSYISYVGYLYGGSKNFVDALGNDKLTANDDPSKDLNFSEYIVPANQMTLQDFYYYLQTHFTDGTGWGLTLLDKTNKAGQAFSGGSQTWYTDECTPYLYAREIFEKLFYGSGYTYVSEFLKGTDFSSYLQDSRWANTIGKFDVNSLIYPYMKHNSNMRVVAPVSSVITQNSQSTSAIISTEECHLDWGFSEVNMLKHLMTLNNTDFTLVEQNANDNLTAYEFTATHNGYYKIKWNFGVKARVLLRNVFNDAVPGDTTWKFNCGGGFNYTVFIQMQKNSTLIGSNRVYTNSLIDGEYDWYEEYTPTTGQTEGFIDLKEGTINYSTDAMWLNIGDTINLYMWVQVPVRYTWWSEHYQEYRTRYVFERWLGGQYSEITAVDYYPKFIEVKLTNAGNNTIVSNELNGGFYEENEFDPSIILNEKTTKLQFFNNFVKMFNLYIEDVSGKTNYANGTIYPPNTLRIEPYQIYYSPELAEGVTNVKDWTNKIDWSSVEYRRCDDYLYNIQSFKKEQDGDFYNDNYDTTYITPYGNREVKGVYCTNNDKNEISLKVSANLCGIVNNSTDVLQCPKVFSLDKSGNIDTKKEYNDGIFFIWRNYMATNTDLTTNYTLKLQSRLHTGNGSFYNVTDYYTADTLNKGYGLDDANLNWGGTEAYYQNMKNTIPTYNDLYTAFYSLEYEEKTAPDAMILRANAYLSVLDIYQLQLSDLIVANGNYYHIIEVNQWENEKKPCQIELIKCKSNLKGTEPPAKRPFPLIEPVVLPVAVESIKLQEELSNMKSTVQGLTSTIQTLSSTVNNLQTEIQLKDNQQIEIQP